MSHRGERPLAPAHHRLHAHGSSGGATAAPPEPRTAAAPALPRVGPLWFHIHGRGPSGRRKLAAPALDKT